MKGMFSRIRTVAAAGVLSAAMAFAAPAAAVTSLAATGTVTGDDINVRSEASTDGSIVGTASSGDTLTVGETTTDSSGATWYEVTLDNGTTGYIRGDFLTVSEDEETEETEESEETEETEETEDTSADEAVTDATTAADQDTGGYQIVLAPDEDGNETYYLYDNNAGERLKISDIAVLQDELNEANQEVSDTQTKYTVILIVLIAAVVILIIACIVLTMKLRDALANGRRERDLTMERRDQRKNNRSADSVESLRRGRGSRGAATASGRGRDDAYASGAGRRIEREEGSSQTGVSRRSTTREADPYAGVAARTRTGSTASSRESSRPARESGTGETRSSYGTSESQPRTVRSTGSAQGQPRRTAAQDPQRRSSSPDSSQARRTSAGTGSGAGDYRDAAQERRSRTSSSAPVSRQSSSDRRTQARNFADDDFDYDFLKLDDDE